MADQVMAQAGALKIPPIIPKAPDYYTLRYKLAWRWRMSQCWVRYALIGRNRGLQGLADFVLGNYFFSASQVPCELMALGEILALQQPKRALEIGTARGGTLFFLTRLASPDATVLSVDLPGGKFGGGYGSRRRWFYQRFARRDQRLQLFQGDSHSVEMIERVRGALQGEPLDYLFIDGDHTYEGVKQDFQMYAPLVRKGGIVAFHDIAEHPPFLGSDVTRFWNEVKSGYRHEEFIEDRSQGWAGIGILYVD